MAGNGRTAMVTGGGSGIDANVPFLTIVASTMPLCGRG